METLLRKFSNAGSNPGFYTIRGSKSSRLLSLKKSKVLFFIAYGTDTKTISSILLQDRTMAVQQIHALSVVGSIPTPAPII